MQTTTHEGMQLARVAPVRPTVERTLEVFMKSMLEEDPSELLGLEEDDDPMETIGSDDEEEEPTELMGLGEDDDEEEEEDPTEFAGIDDDEESMDLQGIGRRGRRGGPGGRSAGHRSSANSRSASGSSCACETPRSRARHRGASRADDVRGCWRSRWCGVDAAPVWLRSLRSGHDGAHG
jgi:hypothetical protein